MLRELNDGAPVFVPLLLAVLLTAAGCGDDKKKNAASPTWHRDVGPIISAQCSGCHTEGGIAPFTLTGYDEAKAYAGAIKARTADRSMPPWGVDNSGACNTWQHARWLSDDDIALIGAWADAGAPRGNPADAPAPADSDEPPTLDRVDATVAPAEAYTPDDSRADDYRCFIVDPRLDSDGFLTGFRMIPDNAAMAHHMILYSLDTDEAEAQALAFDEAEPGPGYTCFGGAGVDGSQTLAGWAPGTPVTRFPEGVGIALKAGRKLVMQMHYNTLSGVTPDRSRLELQVDASVRYQSVLAPVAHLGIYLPPGESYVEQSYTYDLSTLGLPFPLRVWAAFPHMHTLGKTLRVDNLEFGDETCLVNVPRWDFNWQQFYFYEEPLRVSPSSSIRLTCGFDTSDRTRATTWGEGTADEMCLVYFLVSL